MKRELDFDDFIKKDIPWKKIIPVIVVLVLIIAIAIGMVISGHGKKDKTSEVTETETQTEDVDTEDPEVVLNGMNEEETEGSAVAVEEVKEEAKKQVLTTSNETGETTLGIDVSKYQGTIDWASVAGSGIDFAMVRVGYRTTKTGVITEDTNAKYNMQQAVRNGLQIGVYFFSSATSAAEAVEEADWVAGYIAQYNITYPVAFDCENYESADSRQYGMTSAQRTEVAEAFMQEIYNKGYTPMFYAAANALRGNAKWNASSLEENYKMWVAQYPATPYPQTAASSYAGKIAMWQYTNNGSIPGIKGGVDVNVAYFGYASSGNAKDTTDPGNASADVEANMNFSEVNETVTAKDLVNLRNIPSQDTDATVIAQLKNGETATRTGVSSAGWSRLVYNGTTCYAVSNLLTTDLTVKATENEQTGSETTSQNATDMVIQGTTIQTKFVDCNDSVTAKEAVNLRTLPSVTNENSQVVYQLPNGEFVTRTGYNAEYGWSRVVYNGQTLYCVSSYLATEVKAQEVLDTSSDTNQGAGEGELDTDSSSLEGPVVGRPVVEPVVE